MGSTAPKAKWPCVSARQWPIALVYPEGVWYPLGDAPGVGADHFQEQPDWAGRGGGKEFAFRARPICGVGGCSCLPRFKI